MKTIKLKLSSAVVINGGIYRAGREVEVSEDVAKNLLHRGRAVLAGDDVDLNEENEKEVREVEKAGKTENTGSATGNGAENTSAAVVTESSTAPKNG